MVRSIIVVTLAVACQAQSPDSRQKFEVTSVKPCEKSNNGGRGAGASAGRLNLRCAHLRDIIAGAYGSYANGVSPDPASLTVQVEGGPGWLDSDSWDIVAKAEDNASSVRMQGPMMQALLEDRFKLKIHRESRQTPAYVLSVAKDGPKLVATKPGSCIPSDPDHPPPMPAPGQLPLRVCGGQMMNANGLNMPGTTMANLCGQLSLRMDRTVIDKTGISGIFDIHLELSRDDMIPAKLKAFMSAGDPQPPASFDPVGSTIFDAVRKLGLRLEPGRGPVDFLVIDSIERPGEN